MEPKPVCADCGELTSNCKCPVILSRVSDWPTVDDAMIERVLAYEAGQDYIEKLTADEWMTTMYGGRDTEDGRAHIKEVRGMLEAALKL